MPLSLPQQPFDAPLLVAMDENLGVRLGLEIVPLFPQFLAQFDVIVEFSVLHDRHTPVFVVDRLTQPPSRSMIDNRRIPIANRCPSRHKAALAIRPAVADDFSHRIEKPFFAGIRRNRKCHTC